MINNFIRFYEEGDIKNLTSVLLHSCSWQQHGFKAFGSSQINTVLTHWLSLVGRSQTEIVSQVNSENMSTALIKLYPYSNQSSQDKVVLLSLAVEHNGRVVKSVDCVVNTQLVADRKGVDILSLSQSLPNPDPLVLSEYDHQDHLQNNLALPSNLVRNNNVDTSLLDKWWQIHSVGQLSNIDALYSENASIVALSSGRTIIKNELFTSLCHFRTQFLRPFSQLESVTTEDNFVAIVWLFEGDDTDTSERMRLRVVSHLELVDGHIINESSVFDLAAHFKRYPNSTLRLSGI
ncbi:nuclear transport factor 2 family protein [Agaribacter flavus]|uniref:Nuclear transport factor 2 family protein n=1 Tax=Agaribacter flavus TaxID=1902781 RepID=A0ABV7FT85_9ALTE